MQSGVIFKIIQVWVDVDIKIADMVKYLNTISGVRTYASCQGTRGEGGALPYEPYVLAHWPEAWSARLKTEFNVTEISENYGYLHPKWGCENE
jgi:hypothetical protein